MANILWKVLMKKYNRFNIANSVICTLNSNYRIAATLLPTDIVCFRNTSVNTLHKGDDDDDDKQRLAASSRFTHVTCLQLREADLITWG